MIIRVNMIITHMTIIILKIICRFGLTSVQHYGVGYDYGHRSQFERSASTNIDGYYDRVRQKYNDHVEYSSIEYLALVNILLAALNIKVWVLSS